MFHYIHDSSQTTIGRSILHIFFITHAHSPTWGTLSAHRAMTMTGSSPVASTLCALSRRGYQFVVPNHAGRDDEHDTKVLFFLKKKFCMLVPLQWRASVIH